MSSNWTESRYLVLNYAREMYYESYDLWYTRKLECANSGSSLVILHSIKRYFAAFSEQFGGPEQSSVEFDGANKRIWILNYSDRHLGQIGNNPPNGSISSVSAFSIRFTQYQTQYQILFTLSKRKPSMLNKSRRSVVCLEISEGTWKRKATAVTAALHD